MKEKQITIRASLEIHQLIAQAALDRKMSRQAFIIEAVEKFLKDMNRL
jgi:uncharacterized protein (DUF1778 family)